MAQADGLNDGASQGFNIELRRKTMACKKGGKRK